MFKIPRFDRKAVLVIGIVMLMSLAFASVVLAGSVSWSGTLDTSDGSFDGYLAVFGSPSGTQYYEVQFFTVDAAGVYQIRMDSASFSICSDDGMFALYQGSFNPANPLANRLAGNDDFGSFLPGIDVNLTAGTYILVTTSFCNLDTGTYTNSINGPGNISLSTTDTFNPGDDRINATGKDRAAPVAIYCTADGITILKIDPATAKGIDPAAIVISKAEIDEKGVPESENLLLADNAGVQLWRLVGGKFQVNTVYPREPGKPWAANWSGCDRSSFKHITS
ncbi:MAG: hypothetical protein JNM70_17665 [Anaerolineae bacterium]|nr:hypothetical protein [Anaerolineae bacterium]